MRVPNNHDKRLMRMKYVNLTCGPSPAAFVVLLLSDRRVHRTTMPPRDLWRYWRYWLLCPLYYFHRRHCHPRSHFASGDDGESDSTWWHVRSRWAVENGLNEQIEQTEFGVRRP